MTKKELKQSTKKELIKRVLSMVEYADQLESDCASLLRENKRIKEELQVSGEINQLTSQISGIMSTMAIVQKNEAMILAALRDMQESQDDDLS